MDESSVFNLFDYYWFRHEIFIKSRFSSSQIDSRNERRQDSDNDPSTTVLQSEKPSSFSLKSELTSNSISISNLSSPNSEFESPTIQMIISDNDIDQLWGSGEKQKLERPRKRMLYEKRNRCSKSLSDLEFEELKGFMDLGFVFSEEKINPTLISIVPGLQRMMKSTVSEASIDEYIVKRPYLSEAWNQDRYVKNPLYNWRIPTIDEEIEMKDHLKFWARTVASTVR